MLDQLRGMGVFACVVEKNSFSGAARELGITTSAVSQQIRSLEQDMEVVLLHRSTRKLSLTEAGQAFFHSCQDMLSAAERGKIRINELRDDLVGDLRIVSTPEMCANHIIPALSQWMSTHNGLNIHIDADYQFADLKESRIDIALRIGHRIEDPNVQSVALARVDQILVASPSYIHQHSFISRPEDLTRHDVIMTNLAKHNHSFAFQHAVSAETIVLDIASRYSTNNTLIAKNMCMQGHGIARMLYLDVQKDLMNGNLVEVLPEWKLPTFTLYAVMPKSEQQSTKVQRSLEILKQYFSLLSGGRVYKEVS